MKVLAVSDLLSFPSPDLESGFAGGEELKLLSSYGMTNLVGTRVLCPPYNYINSARISITPHPAPPRPGEGIKSLSSYGHDKSRIFKDI